MSRRDTDWQSLALLAAEKGALRRLVLSKPQKAGQGRITGRLCKNGEKRLLALEEALPDGKVRHRNIPLAELGEALCELGEGYGQINLVTSAGDAEYRRSKKGAAVLLGGDALRRTLGGGSFADTLTETLFRQKAYILQGNEPFLQALGITDKNGRIHDKKQAKFRQINRFLEHIADILPDMPREGDLLIYDLCCGKSYLSFAVYHYFTAVQKRRVEMLCMDLKQDVMDDCAAIAMSLGYTGMRFVCADVRTAPRERRPDLVLSLHACDIATDIVLHLGAELAAGVILSTPCCHHDLGSRIRCEALSFVTRYPQLRGKLCEALTDACRLARLRAKGYEVAAMELTDPDDTPKNTLLRARRVHMTQQQLAEAEAEYRRVLRYLLGEGAEDYPAL